MIPGMQRGLDIAGTRAVETNQNIAGWIRCPWTTGQAMFLGTLAVAALDGIDALVFSALRGVPPMRLFQANDELLRDVRHRRLHQHDGADGEQYCRPRAVQSVHRNARRGRPLAESCDLR
jgi:hypothetical protein